MKREAFIQKMTDIGYSDINITADRYAGYVITATLENTPVPYLRKGREADIEALLDKALPYYHRFKFIEVPAAFTTAYTVRGPEGRPLLCAGFPAANERTIENVPGQVGFAWRRMRR